MARLTVEEVKQIEKICKTRPQQISPDRDKNQDIVFFQGGCNNKQFVKKQLIMF